MNNTSNTPFLMSAVSGGKSNIDNFIDYLISDTTNGHTATNRHSNSSTTTSGSASSADLNNSIGASGVSRSLQLDFEKEHKKIQQFETINKEFHKDVKTYVEKLDDLSKSETKMIHNLENFIEQTSENANAKSSESTPDATVEEEFVEKFKVWRDVLAHHGQSCETLRHACQARVIEPIKKLNSLFPNVNSAIKRRECAYNEFLKQKAKLEKLQEKERTGVNLVRIEETQQAVNVAKQQFLKEHIFLMEELPKLYNSRLEYIKPCVNALLESQSSFYQDYATFYEKILLNKNDNINSSLATGASNPSTPSSSANVDKLDNEINECMSQIKELSIVAGD